MWKAHIHPRNPDREIWGRRLQPGDTIQPEDVYDAMSGIWVKAPCAGLVLQEGCATYWVRK